MRGIRVRVMAAALAALAVAGAGIGSANRAEGSIFIVPSAVPFVDISGTGTSVGTLSDDSEHTIAGATLNFIGNGLLAGGRSIRVGNNGGVLWGNSATDPFTTGAAGVSEVGYYNAGPLNTGGNPSIAGMTASNIAANGNGNNQRQLLAPLWDDYLGQTGATPASIKWQIIANDLIVQWTNEDHFAASGSGFVTFQMVVHGGVSINSGQSLVDFVYQDTLYQANQYQNDGGSATIGYKNWGLNGLANDVEFGIGGGGTSATADPTFASGTGMQPKVSGWAAGSNSNLPHSVSIIPEPATLTLVSFGVVALIRRKR